jgi:glycosyltransferase involved in cell wall biosynthesis
LTVVGLDRKKIDFDPEEERKIYNANLLWIELKRTSNLPRNFLGYIARYMETYFKLVKTGVSLKPHVIHVHEDSSLPIALAIKRITGAKIVYDAHELYREMTSATALFWKKWAAKMESMAMQKCSGIIACNSQRAEVMKNDYGAPFLPSVIRNMPPSRQFRPTTVLRDYVQKINAAIRHLCLHQGGIWKGRGMETVLRSLCYLPEDTAIVLVGGGDEPFIERLRQDAIKIGVENRFFIHPPVNQAKLFEMTCSADLGIVIYENISRNNYLCAPNRIYEYAQAGLPIVGADLPPIKEFLKETQTGEIFNADDPRSLADSINRILSNENKSEIYRNNGLKAANIYCWENESKRLLDLYERVLE